MSSSSEETIMSVAELIDNAFGDEEVNIVHHKLLQTVLYLLARHLRVLERRVVVQFGPIHRPSSSLSVTEVKLHAMLKQKKKIRSKSISKSMDRTLPEKSTDVTFSTRKAKAIDKPSGGKVTGDKKMRQKSSSDKTDKTSSDMTSTDKTSSDKTSTEKTSSNKTSTEQSSSNKTSTDKTSSDKTSTEKTSSDKTSTEKTSSDKTSSDKTSTEKSSSGKTSTDKTSSDKTSTEKSSSDKTSTEKSASDKTSAEKSSSDKTSTDKTSSGKTSSYVTSSDKASTDKTSSEKPSTDRSSDKDTTDKQSTSKSTTDKSSSSQPSTDNKSQKKDTTGKASKSIEIEESPAKQSSILDRKLSSSDAEHRGLQDYQNILEQIELQRERELRVIHQRADSRVDQEKSPTPMASLDSVEATYEKLLVVERVPAEEARARAAREKSGTQRPQGGPRLSIVTQDQFEKLALEVSHIQEKLGPVALPGFPENAQLMNELRKGASLTDAMAALQLSARLEAAEKTLKNMLSLLTQLASQTSGLNLTSGLNDDIEVLFGVPGDKIRQSGTQAKSPTSSKKKALSPGRSKLVTSVAESPSDTSIALPQSTVIIHTSMTAADLDLDQEIKKDRVTYEELDSSLKQLQDEIMKKVTVTLTRTANNADSALKIATKLEGRIESSLDLGQRMEELENLVANYVEQINVLDTGLSSEMTNYQEELTQMQHDLEVGLETMADALANTGGDATAVAELNAHFSDLQAGIDETVSRQKELRDNQTVLAVDLDALRKQIEVLRETKSDREEVVDALRDKAGLGALNGLVSHQQFNAVRGDFEKRIGTAYDKFNNQEVAWQKAIDDLLRELHEKADIVQVEGLRDAIYRYLGEFRNKVKFIMDIVGEPNAAALAKRLNRDTACLSCAAPAHMKAEEPSGMVLPAVRPKTIGAEAPKPKEDGDHGLCIPGQTIPHPRDPRSHVCQRWCGGSHTIVNSSAPSRVPPGIIITPAKRAVTIELGTDGKSYAVDKVPCSQCILPTAPPSPVHSDQEKPTGAGDSEVIPYHMCPAYVSYIEPGPTGSMMSTTAIVSD